VSGFDVVNDLAALHVDVRTVDDLRPYGPAHQRRRRRNVQAMAFRARAILGEAAAGKRSLTEAVLTASALLRAAEVELVKKMIDEDVE
jgi:hypothetical protein